MPVTRYKWYLMSVPVKRCMYMYVERLLLLTDPFIQCVVLLLDARRNYINKLSLYFKKQRKDSLVVWQSSLSEF